jgi:hypothetical protein
MGGVGIGAAGGVGAAGLHHAALDADGATDPGG